MSSTLALGVKDDGQDPHLAKMEKLKYAVTTYLCLRTSTLLRNYSRHDSLCRQI